MRMRQELERPMVPMPCNMLPRLSGGTLLKGPLVSLQTHEVDLEFDESGHRLLNGQKEKLVFGQQLI